MKRILIFLAVIFIIQVSCFAQEPVLKTDAYLNPPKYILTPSVSEFDCHKTENRKFTGISSLAMTKKGRMFAVWYAGIEPKEDHNNYVVVAQSDDKGETWKEILIIDPDLDGPLRAFDPEIWVDPT